MNRIAPDPDPHDHALDLGPASHARPSSIERIRGQSRHTAQREAPITARVYADSTAFDLLRFTRYITERQHRAGIRLHKLWVAAGLEPRTTARIPHASEPSDLDDTDSNADIEIHDRDTCRRMHRAIMRDMPAALPAILDELCMWHAGRAVRNYRATDVHAALDWLADHWDIPREGA